jgi:hypothetical protein
VAGERGGDTRAGAPPGQVEPAADQVPLGQRGAAEAAASAAADGKPAELRPAPGRKAPADELLCTICGLTACWQKPR